MLLSGLGSGSVILGYTDGSHPLKCCLKVVVMGNDIPLLSVGEGGDGDWGIGA